MELHGKTAIITGGNQGIGRATALRLAEAGASVIIAARNERLNQETRMYIEKASGQKATAFSLDVSVNEQVTDVFAKILNRFGHIDILVNNAGICSLSQPFEELSLTEWDHVMDINLKGIVHCVKAAIPQFKKQNSGKIINVASLAGEVGGIATSADYVASKAAVIGLTKSLARYLGPYHVNVNAVAPGFINTTMTADMSINTSSIPLGHVGEPLDVANGILFLASEHSRYITGTTLDVNGGLYMK